MDKHKLYRKLLSLVFPEHCLCCDVIVESGKALCDKCNSKLKADREISYLPIVAKNKRQYMVECFTAGCYRGGLKDSMHRFKFGNVYGYAYSFAILIANAGFDFNDFDVITYVPLTNKKRRERGYNQSELLAKELSKIYNIKCEPLLVKKQDKKQQKELSRKQRRGNVRGSFDIQGEIKGRRILLADDIITSGATVSECARLLLNAEAGKVAAVAALKTPLGMNTVEELHGVN